MTLAFLMALLSVSAALRVGMEQFAWLAEWDPELGDHVPTALSAWVTRFLQRIVRACTALAIWNVMDMLWLPWLKIEDVAMGWGDWTLVDPLVRGLVALGWFAALSALLLAFCLGV